MKTPRFILLPVLILALPAGLHALDVTGTNYDPSEGVGNLQITSTGSFAPDKGGSMIFGAESTEDSGVLAGIAGRHEDGETSSSANGYLQFSTNPNIGEPPILVERMRITSYGNVGIGTTNPTQKLSVNGTIQAKEVIVETDWSDYVFAPGYKLASLAEVEAHIAGRGHLPDIPSAEEVAEHGIRVGDMQAKLLAKIEELTLHLIAQEKRLAAQATQLATQSSRLTRLEAENAAARQGE